MKHYLKLPKKTLVFEVIQKLYVSGTWEKERRNTSSQSPLPLMCSDKYPNKYLSINIV